MVIWGEDVATVAAVLRAACQRGGWGEPGAGQVRTQSVGLADGLCVEWLGRVQGTSTVVCPGSWEDGAATD